MHARFCLLKPQIQWPFYSKKDNAFSSFVYLRRIIRLDELGQTFVVRLVTRL